jgi:hypothetical protein
MFKRPVISGRLEIFGISGNRLFADTFSGDRYLLSADGLHAGYYILKFTDGSISRQIAFTVG